MGIGVATPTNVLSFGNDAAKTVWIENSAETTVGRALTINAGSTIAGATTNVAGGNLILNSGLGKGTGASSIIFQTGRTLATGSTLQTLTTAMTILGNGNVGIGTTSPLETTHINGSGLLLTGSANGNTAYLEFGDITGGTTRNNDARIVANRGSGGGADLLLQTANRAQTAYATVLTATRDGNIGIGITAPTAKLHIVGSTDTQQLIVKANATQTANLQEWQNSSGTVLAGIQGRGTFFSTLGVDVDSLFIGSGAGNTAASGAVRNIAIGSNAMDAVTSGDENVAIGFDALTALTTGLDNVAIGAYALRASNAVSNYNMAIGAYSLAAVTTGDSNVGIGFGTGGNNQTGSRNIYIGNQAGAGSGSNSHSYNTFIGDTSGFAVDGGGSNTAIGSGTLFSLTNGTNNVCIGVNSGNALTTTSGNIFIGFSAGVYQTGTNVLLIGNQAYASAAVELTNSIIYGVMASTPASQTLALNAVVTTNGSVTSPNFISNIATGTAPIAVTSTTVNTNLNAELWNGKKLVTGSGTLTAGTTTTVTIAGAKASSIILIQSTSAAITTLGVYVSAKNSGNFVLTHLLAVGGEAFDYVIIS